MSDAHRRGFSPRERSATPSVGEVISRIVFGGFWALVASGSLAAAVLLFAQGMPAGGLVCIGVALLAALYSRYLFRGGRFRILFW